MKLNLKGIFTARYWTLLMSALLLAMVAACGGGNGSAGSPLGGSGSGSGTGGTTGTTTTTNGSISLSITDTAGNSASVIPNSSYLTVSATVKDATNKLSPNTLVTFTVNNAAGVISPTLGTAVTNSSGVAQVTLQSGTANGAGTVTATATVGANQIASPPVAFTNSVAASTTGGTPSLALTLVSSGTCAASTLSSSCPLTASASVTDGSGNTIAPTLVTFSTTSTLASLNPSAGTALTNSSGIATVSVIPASLQAALTQTGAGGQVNATATVNGVTLVKAAYFTMGNTSLSLALTAPSGAATSISAYGTTTIAVTVSSNNTVYTAQPVTVNFTSACQANGAATFPATATTVNGIASITYRDNGCGQLDTVTANVTGVASAVSAAITVAKPKVSAIKFISATPSTESIVLPGSGGNGRTSQATLVFQVVDTSGNPVPNAVVNFTNSTSTTVGQLTTQSQTTDSNGNVTATVNAVSVGTFRITATLGSDSTISTISDSVIVSTGIPVGGSFTVAPVTLNLAAEDGGGGLIVTTDNVTVYLADANGNPVAAGTPVSATTDAGTIQNVNGNSGGCTTNALGNCGLLYTTSRPAPSNGIATITVTTTDGSNTTLSGYAKIIWSSSAISAYLPGSTTGVVNLVVPDPANATQITTTNCSSNVQIIFADLNGNPLAFGSTFAASSTQNGVSPGATIPATVPNIGPDPKTGIGGDVYSVNGTSQYIQGVSVAIPLTLTSPAPTCKTVANGGTAGAGAATFTVKVTPSGASPVQFTFTLLYPA